jgi:iron complex transport system substrate-binding protein
MKVHENEASELKLSLLSRRNFVKGALATGTVVATGGLLAACGSDDSNDDAANDNGGASNTQTPSATPVTITDMTGRTVTLDAPAEHVVALTASACEILYAIGAGSTLVGRGEYCNYPEEVLNIQTVQSGSDTNIEQIIALDPDLLLMSTMAQTEEQIRHLEEAGIAVFVTDAESIAQTYDSIEVVGELMGRSAEASKVVKDMKDIFDDLKSKAAAVATTPKKTIYFEVSPLEYGLWTTGKGTFMDEVANLLSLENCFGELTGWAEISEEQVLERKPDYILTVGMYFGEGPTPIESILARPGWADVPAVKNAAILNLTADELSRPGPRLALGAQMLYDFVYGG